MLECEDAANPGDQINLQGGIRLHPGILVEKALKQDPDGTDEQGCGSEHDGANDAEHVLQVRQGDVLLSPLRYARKGMRRWKSQ